MSNSQKAEGAFRTIGEVASATGVAPHVLRYWETRFPQLRPVTRAGNRRYYRPADVALVQRIQRLLGTEGYTVKGVQKLLASETRGGSAVSAETAAAAAPPPTGKTVSIGALLAIRDHLQDALNAY
ncbi:MerR family transcriptional regulator [Sphingomonas sp. ABOLG]|uniref:MerR family transcriptional regulator n=1 Tax=Sphingomonas sp. ABOLG TaxID=1985880 RepID=UPI000F7DAE4C|nr:MerR family transcriptional regulator [Sphingomonas sp. ABOLG]RSV16503.1 MerR family transcriptional regulator [Sphingomonas sp. ABOLG]